MMTLPTRRSLLRTGFGLIGAQAIGVVPAWAKEPPHDVTFAEDFDELWRTLGERYCYFGEKTTDWNAVRRFYRPRALAAESREAFGAIVADVLRELYDAHTHMSDPPADGPRGPYFDLWVEPAQDGSALVTSVRASSAAADIGIRVGDAVLAVDGRPIRTIAAGVMPRCLSRPDPAATAFAYNVAVSGRRAQPRSLSLRSANGSVREIRVPVKTPVAQPNVDSRMLANDIGLIVIRNFDDDAVVAAVDAALLRFKDTAGLIIDVRENGGGDTAVARPIMGRFITRPKPYARMRRREGARLRSAWTETVEPRGPFTYDKPVAVLTTRWSASMAEGFPMGMRGIGRAMIVGTPMMRVGAAVFPLRLDRTGLELQYSAEPVYDVMDRPRWLLEPDILVEGGGDILAVAMSALRAGTVGPARPA
ncbi:peptidase S41 [Sphingomonas aliaeris]|uniref:Peptidase S41 n=1 Tax=Sphingomonas aliaeris TaxID=2759526 RepID=A0A974S4C8_9SPHN|nr:S41 family peptidase [Sphingomonas aliaeris]QQV76975.1 peptidase S41 [Sphingomonas aliaeris]